MDEEDGGAVGVVGFGDVDAGVFDAHGDIEEVAYADEEVIGSAEGEGERGGEVGGERDGGAVEACGGDLLGVGEFKDGAFLIEANEGVEGAGEASGREEGDFGGPVGIEFAAPDEGDAEAFDVDAGAEAGDHDLIREQELAVAAGGEAFGELNAEGDVAHGRGNGDFSTLDEFFGVELDVAGESGVVGVDGGPGAGVFQPRGGGNAGSTQALEGEGGGGEEKAVFGITAGGGTTAGELEDPLGGLGLALGVASGPAEEGLSGGLGGVQDGDAVSVFEA